MEQDALGLWLSENGNEKVQIYKKDGKLAGSMSWMKYDTDENGNPVKDVKNPDPEYRDRPLVGIEFLSGFEYVGNGWFTGGQIYDMGSGSTYSARIYMPDSNTAKIRGYVGIPLFGRTEVCTKIL